MPRIYAQKNDLRIVMYYNNLKNLKYSCTCLPLMSDVLSHVPPSLSSFHPVYTIAIKENTA